MTSRLLQLSALIAMPLYLGGCALLFNGGSENHYELRFVSGDRESYEPRQEFFEGFDGIALEDEEVRIQAAPEPARSDCVAVTIFNRARRPVTLRLSQASVSVKTPRGRVVVNSFQSSAPDNLSIAPGASRRIHLGRSSFCRNLQAGDRGSKFEFYLPIDLPSGPARYRLAFGVEEIRAEIPNQPEY